MNKTTRTILQIFLLLLGALGIATLYYAWVIVPQWILVLRNSNVSVPATTAFVIALSNNLRTPIGFLATMSCSGIYLTLFLWSFVAKKKV